MEKVAVVAPACMPRYTHVVPLRSSQVNSPYTGAESLSFDVVRLASAGVSTTVGGTSWFATRFPALGAGKVHRVDEAKYVFQ